jgi:hypothetical protein
MIGWRSILSGLVVIALLTAVIAVIRSRTPQMGPLSNGQQAVFPPLSDIEEMRADVYNSPESRIDIHNVLIPKESHEEVLTFFRPGKEGWFFPELKEVGHISIKTKDGRTTTVVFYQDGKDLVCYTIGSVRYVHETTPSRGTNKLDALIRDIHIKEFKEKRN